MLRHGVCRFRPLPVRTFAVAATTTVGNGPATAARYGVIPLSMTTTSRTMSQVASPTTSKSSRPLLRAVSALVVGTLALGSGLLTLAEFQHRRAQRANDTATRQTPATETELRRMFIDADPTFAFQHRSTFDLVRSWIVFELCQYPALVDYTPPLLTLLERVGLTAVASAAIKLTFFRQFCGGESATELRPVMAALKGAGIGSILDLSVESDLPTEVEATSANETTPVRSLVDLRADAIADQIKLCIQAASSSEGAFVAVKVTGMGSTRALKNVSGVAGFARDLFVCHATNELTTTGTTSETTADAISGTGDANRSLTLDYDGFCGVVRQLPGAAAHPPSDEQLREWFTMASGCARGSIGARVNWSGFSSVISFTRDTTRHLFVGKVAMPVDSRWTARTWSVSNKFMPEVTLRDITEFEKVVERIDRVCQEAQRMRVRLMLDAEQTYFQPAIDMVAMLMMAKYNRSVSAGPLVYNTYQFYLKGTLDRLRANIDHADKGAEPFHFAAKVVRGAYLTSERKRAAENQLLDPIHDEIKQTHRAYDTAVTLLLERAATAEARSSASPLGVSLCVATHNKDSVVHACVEMSRHGIAPADGVVQFGQLLGMHDHISYTLARHNYPVAKYVPYGAVGDVIPYLLRRAQENRSIFKVSDSLALDDQTLIKREILRRVRNAFSLRATSL